MMTQIIILIFDLTDLNLHVNEISLVKYRFECLGSTSTLSAINLSALHIKQI